MFHLIATYFRLGALNELRYRANFWINLLQSSSPWWPRWQA